MGDSYRQVSLQKYMPGRNESLQGMKFQKPSTILKYVPTHVYTYRGPENVVVVGGSSDVEEVCRVWYQISVEQSIKNLQQSVQTCEILYNYIAGDFCCPFSYELNISY